MKAAWLEVWPCLLVGCRRRQGWKLNQLPGQTSRANHISKFCCRAHTIRREYRDWLRRAQRTKTTWTTFRDSMSNRWARRRWLPWLILCLNRQSQPLKIQHLKLASHLLTARCTSLEKALTRESKSPRPSTTRKLVIPPQGRIHCWRSWIERPPQTMSVHWSPTRIWLMRSCSRVTVRLNFGMNLRWWPRSKDLTTLSRLARNYPVSSQTFRRRRWPEERKSKRISRTSCVSMPAKASQVTRSRKTRSSSWLVSSPLPISSLMKPGHPHPIKHWPKNCSKAPPRSS